MRDQEQIGAVVDLLGVTITARAITPSKQRAAEWDCDARHWSVTLCYQGRRMKTTFSQGSAHTAPPTAADVLGCLASDASGVDGRTFEEWASDYGYDGDLRRAERTYYVCQATAVSLRHVFGDALERITAAEW